ncbi:MAG TPA: bifunctional folylpolyglutamate synthase/dihydrofolate synthase [Bacteroidetes bacterium]|nr:bifunctional folylpolyglutamate synthase/dihydrofolate synthase [Bacteroidota bacterium]
MYQRIGGAAYKADLNTTLALDRVTGHPHTAFRSVHIAGTNGKGSVSHMLASVLQECGLKTGLYTSPHLKDFRERIRINGVPVSRKEVIDFVLRYQDLFEQLQPSFFEMTVALAFWYFKKCGVEIAVVETGMGGRLDSTNIIEPLCSVITNIGMDHTRFLGDTREKIAGEKAGIMKKGIPVVIGEYHKDTARIFERVASEKQAPLHFAGSYYEPEGISGIEGSSRVFTFRKKPAGQILRVKCGLTATYQAKNLITVLKTLDVLQERGISLRQEAILKGLHNVVENTDIRGRWQVMGRRPLMVADMAHNEDGIREVIGQLTNYAYRRLHVVLGMVQDKDHKKILGLLPGKANYYFTQASVPRSMEAGELAVLAGKSGLKGRIYPRVASAIGAALGCASEDDMILITGSTFVVADLLEWMDGGKLPVG